jgi:hypothetical protein
MNLPLVPNSGSSTGSTGSSGSSGAVDPPMPTWTYLYAAYFGPPQAPTNPDAGPVGGLASCGGIATVCHQTSNDSGFKMAPGSGFACGTTPAECYQGMVMATPPLIGAMYKADPTKSPLMQALYRGGNPFPTANNMPQTLGYTFSATDLNLIQTWVANGAPQN